MEISGSTLEFRWHGPPPEKAPTLVFLHEGLGSVSLWRDFPDELADLSGCGALVYSRLGYGGSDPIAVRRDVDFMHREAVETLPRLLEKTRVAKPILYGHSDGASIALLFAAAHPPQARALVLEAPHVFVEELTVKNIAALGDVYREGELRNRLARHHRDVGSTFWSWNEVWLDPAFRDWNIESQLAAVSCPVLLLQGHDDQYGSVEQIHSVANGVAGDAEVTLLERCGHSPHRDRRDCVLERTARFVRGILG